MKVKMSLDFPILLTVIFLVLKLANVISWDWVWVLCPLWISLIVFVFLALVMWITVIHNNNHGYSRHNNCNIHSNSTPLYWDAETQDFY